MAIEKPLCRKILRSTIGFLSVSSQIRKAMNPMTAVRPRPMISGEANQSRSLPRSSMICNAPTQRIISSRPMTSTRALTVFVSWLNSTRQTRKPAPMAIGTLTRKIEPQPKLSHRVPPSTGPAMGPIRVVMAQMAMAWGWSFFGKMLSSRVCDNGISGPPQKPCRTRAMIRV